MSSKTPAHNVIVAVVGLCGAGKSEVASYFVDHGFSFLRFGQLTLDEVARRGLEPTEANERPIREEFRRQHGMAAFAVLNMPKIDAVLESGKDLLIDGLYSWSEYKALKEKYGERLTVIAVYAPPSVRYERLANRHTRHGDDPKLRFRSFTPDEAKSRDYAEIENLEKAGPIAMADYTIDNSGSFVQLQAQLAVVHQAVGENS